MQELWTHVADKPISVWKLIQSKTGQLLTAQCELPVGAKYFIESDSTSEPTFKTIVTNELRVIDIGIWVLDDDYAVFTPLSVVDCKPLVGIDDVVYNIGHIEKATGLWTYAHMWQTIWVQFKKVIRCAKVNDVMHFSNLLPSNYPH
jgi:hypothetical protein